MDWRRHRAVAIAIAAAWKFRTGWLVVMAMLACPLTAGAQPDAGTDGGPGCPVGMICLDGSAPDSGPPDAGTDAGPGACFVPTPTGQFGGHCRGGTMCITPLDCHEELRFDVPTTTGGTYEVVMYPGGVCTLRCDTDPGVCGDCTSCTDHSRVGRIRIPAYGLTPSGRYTVGSVCRDDCTPNPATNGDCPTNMTCEIDGQTCVEACQSDGDCNLTIEGGLFRFDSGGPWTCDSVTGRCTLSGSPGASAGDPCTADTDCMDDGECLRSAPEGFCTRIGCDAPGFECDAPETCALRDGRSLCLPACRVGEEPEGDRLGVGGHGAGCAPGRACYWDGRSGDTAGGCMPGNYNDLTTPNVGGACLTNADCYSPFGYGTCLRGSRSPVGVCSITDCVTGDAMGISPGISTSTRVCDESAGETCIPAVDVDGLPFCMKECTDASECGPGLACAAGVIGTTVRACWPECDRSSDCLAGASCESADGGVCDRAGGDRDCFCIGGSGPRDAGPGPVDAGGESDAALAMDAGSEPEPPADGCSCRAVGAAENGTLGASVLFFALLLLRRRRSNQSIPR